MGKRLEHLNDGPVEIPAWKWGGFDSSCVDIAGP